MLVTDHNSQSVGKWVLNYYRHVDSNDNIFSVVLVSVEKSSKHESQYVMDISSRFLHGV